MIGRCVDKPLFFSALLIVCVYAMTILMSEHTHNRNTRGGGVSWSDGEGGDTKIRCFFEHYNGLLLCFITHCFLLLAYFPVGIVYIPVQKLIFFDFDP